MMGCFGHDSKVVSTTQEVSKRSCPFLQAGSSSTPLWQAAMWRYKCSLKKKCIVSSDNHSHSKDDNNATTTSTIAYFRQKMLKRAIIFRNRHLIAEFCQLPELQGFSTARAPSVWLYLPLLKSAQQPLLQRMPSVIWSSSSRARQYSFRCAQPRSLLDFLANVPCIWLAKHFEAVTVLFQWYLGWIFWGLSC